MQPLIGWGQFPCIFTGRMEHSIVSIHMISGSQPWCVLVRPTPASVANHAKLLLVLVSALIGGLCTCVIVAWLMCLPQQLFFTLSWYPKCVCPSVSLSLYVNWWQSPSSVLFLWWLRLSPAHPAGEQWAAIFSSVSVSVSPWTGDRSSTQSCCS